MLGVLVVGRNRVVYFKFNMRVWCLTVSIPAFQAGGTDSNSVTRSIISGCRKAGIAPHLG